MSVRWSVSSSRNVCHLDDLVQKVRFFVGGEQRPCIRRASDVVFNCTYGLVSCYGNPLDRKVMEFEGWRKVEDRRMKMDGPTKSALHPPPFNFLSCSLRPSLLTFPPPLLLPPLSHRSGSFIRVKTLGRKIGSFSAFTALAFPNTVKLFFSCRSKAFFLISSICSLNFTGEVLLVVSSSSYL